MSAAAVEQKTIRSTIPARLDRLSWSPFQIFGAFGPVFYGALIGDGSSRTGLYVGYIVGGAIMVIGGIVELAIGIKAKGKSLEDITKPITSTPESATAG